MSAIADFKRNGGKSEKRECIFKKTPRQNRVTRTVGRSAGGGKERKRKLDLTGDQRKNRLSQRCVQGEKCGNENRYCESLRRGEEC
ncbi:hypothetical protein TNCV_501981 [Trichonephila clavipes]|nr:hypothetical protein TNCV_501981 [Trichonephila clavipes]